MTWTGAPWPSEMCSWNSRSSSSRRPPPWLSATCAATAFSSAPSRRCSSSTYGAQRSRRWVSYVSGSSTRRLVKSDPTTLMCLRRCALRDAARRQSGTTPPVRARAGACENSGRSSKALCTRYGSLRIISEHPVDLVEEVDRVGETAATVAPVLEPARSAAVQDRQHAARRHLAVIALLDRARDDPVDVATHRLGERQVLHLRILQQLLLRQWLDEVPDPGHALRRHLDVTQVLHQLEVGEALGAHLPRAVRVGVRDVAVRSRLHRHGELGPRLVGDALDLALDDLRFVDNDARGRLERHERALERRSAAVDRAPAILVGHRAHLLRRQRGRMGGDGSFDLGEQRVDVDAVGGGDVDVDADEVRLGRPHDRPLRRRSTSDTISAGAARRVPRTSFRTASEKLPEPVPPVPSTPTPYFLMISQRSSFFSISLSRSALRSGWCMPRSSEGSSLVS